MPLNARSTPLVMLSRSPRARVEDARQPPVRRKRAHDPVANLRRLVPGVQRPQVLAVLIAVAGVEIRVVRIRVAGAGLIEGDRRWPCPRTSTACSCR